MNTRIRPENHHAAKDYWTTGLSGWLEVSLGSLERSMCPGWPAMIFLDPGVVNVSNHPVVQLEADLEFGACDEKPEPSAVAPDA